MNRRIISLAWLATILLVAVFAGTSWLNLGLTPEAGEQKLEMTGYLVFPIISALVLLQAAALLATFFTPAPVGRVIAAVLAPVMLVHGVLVVLSLEASFQTAVSAEIAQVTGVAGVASQFQFVSTALDTYLWVGYLAALLLNVAVLAVRALLKLKPADAKAAKESLDSVEDLWESQK